MPRALSVLSEIFFQNAGADGDPPGLAKGTRWDGMPYHVTLGHPGWWVTSEQVEARSVFSLLIFVVSFLLAATFNCRRLLPKYPALPSAQNCGSGARRVLLLFLVFVCFCACVHVCV